MLAPSTILSAKMAVRKKSYQKQTQEFLHQKLKKSNLQTNKISLLFYAYSLEYNFHYLYMVAIIYASKISATFIRYHFYSRGGPLDTGFDINASGRLL